jgi:hypothetical protein
MILGSDMPMIDMLQLMEEAQSAGGFTSSDLEAILESELHTDHMLEYINAVLANRMN